METPSETEAEVVRDAVLDLWRTTQIDDEPTELGRLAQWALDRLEHAEDRPATVVGLMSRCEYKIYWTQDGTEANTAWRTLHAAIDAVLDT